MSDFQIETPSEAPVADSPVNQPPVDFTNVMTQIAQQQQSQSEQFNQLLSALSPKATPVAEKPFEYDVSTLLTPEELTDRSLDIGFMNKIASGLANTLMAKSNSEMAELRAQLASSNAALTSLQSRGFEKEGGDILFTTKEGKNYMAQVDPSTGLSRSDLAQAIAKTGNTKSVEAFLLASARQVKNSIEKAKQTSVPKLGGGNVTIANTDARKVQSLNDQAAILRAKVAPVAAERDRLIAINRELFALTNKATVTN